MIRELFVALGLAQQLFQSRDRIFAHAIELEHAFVGLDRLCRIVELLGQGSSHGPSGRRTI